jgi:AcrR family transcriptional regulator
MRDIAQRARVSLGNVYNYFETKEAIFESIISRRRVGIDRKIKESLEALDDPLDPKEMRQLGEMIGEMVAQNQDFWLLMYIDALEFQNRHFGKMFENLAEKFRRLFEGKFASAIERGDVRRGVDPAVGFTVAYMQFFNYFLIEKLFGGNLHLGLTDEQALNYMTKMFSYGVLSEDRLTQFKKTTIKKTHSAED